MTRYDRTLADLEAEARVAPGEQVETQPTSAAVDRADPEDVDRIMLLANPAGSGRLRPR